ncbi:MAG: tetratricopeptide repeat protein [Bryobacteraceae bacterium]
MSRFCPIPLPLFAAAFLAIAGLSSCRKAGEPSPPVLRVAILPWEDHSPSADTAWLARLLPFSLRRQLESTPRLQLAEVRSATDFAGPTHELSGFLDARNNRIEAHFFLYELPSHRLAAHRTLTVPATGWRRLLEETARFLASSLRVEARLNPVAVHTEPAARSLARGLTAASPASALPAFRSATEADPGCGWCWLGLAETTAAVEGADALRRVIDTARQHRASFDPLTLARLDLLAARFSPNRLDTTAAQEKIAALSPSDPLIQLRLAEAYTANRQFSRAEAALRNALTIEPGQAVLWNSLAYARAWQGRFDDALEAVRRYAQLDPGPNPADTRGEILMIAGRFPEAAAAFEESYQKDPTFNGGAAMEKAALCWMLAGDSRRASQSLSHWFRDRAARNDRSAGLAQARWELLLGQAAAATIRFARLARDRQDPLSPVAASMLALRLAFSEPPAATSWLPHAPLRNGWQDLYRVYAAAALDPSSVQSIRDERLQLELRALSLTARHDWTRAADAWRTVIERSPGGTDSIWRELRAFCLVQTGQVNQAAQELGNAWPLLSKGQMEFYDFLVYPALLYTRAEIARSAGRMGDARRLYDLFLQFASARPDLAPQAARARAAARL